MNFIHDYNIEHDYGEVNRTEKFQETPIPNRNPLMNFGHIDIALNGRHPQRKKKPKKVHCCLYCKKI